MENNQSTRRIHPLVAGAAVSVMLVSLVGVAAITGILPNSHSNNAPTAAVATDKTAVAAALADNAGAAGMEGKPGTGPDSATADKPAAPVSRHVPAHTAHVRHAPVRSSEEYEPATVAHAPAICSSCGRIESVQAVQHAEKPSGVGVVAGAVLGGVLGNQVGGGNGRTLATVAGAVGGGYAGNEVEKRTRTSTSYHVRVRMEDGSIRTFPYAAAPGWNVGDRVQVVNGSLTARG